MHFLDRNILLIKMDGLLLNMNPAILGVWVLLKTDQTVFYAG